jgi:glycerol-3-phosphate dehydrogenase
MKRFTESYKGEKFDLIVIGGGITGAAVAYDAASRGLSVALIEKNDFGGATSAATSKLIHGGLRYLATMEFGLVRESLRERKTMENIAPNFVYPMATMVTTNKLKITNTKLVIKIGMILYDILSFDKGRTWDRSKKIPLHRSLSRDKVIELEPSVKRDGLTGASVYYDCISIFPERLTLAFIKSAVENGAVVANYAEVEEFLFTDGKRVAGVRVRDKVTGKLVDITGDLTINCGGPWADIILGLARREKAGEQLRRSEGIHIITKKLVNDHILGTMTAKGKHIFIIPWRGRSIIGTTDKEYIGKPDEYRVTAKSIQELLDEINDSYGFPPLSFKDILHTWGGLRPLVEDQTEDVYESSRKYEIYDNKEDGLDGLITVEGGKYTTSRNLAEHVLAIVEKKLGRKLKKVSTHTTYLKGSEIPDMEAFIGKIVKENPDFDGKTLAYLGRNYGLEYAGVLELARKNRSLATVLNDDGEILAQAVYAVRFELARSLKDVLFRRTGIGTLGNPGVNVIKLVAQTVAKELRWNPVRLRKEFEDARAAFTIPKPAEGQSGAKKSERKKPAGRSTSSKKSGGRKK